MRSTLSIIMFLGLLSVYGQNKMNHWHFGSGAGLDFSSGNPVAASSSINAYEGGASISDGCSALFYTDGDTVFNRLNNPMPNGIGLAGKCHDFGGSSNSQSAIIIPKPNSDSLFYIFTVDCIEDTLIDGLQYSIVDMSLNGGLGDVVVKNVPLKSTVEEKITATRHTNGCDYWIVVHEYYTNAFYAYLLTSSGLNPSPVISNTGQMHGQTPQLFDCARGYMKFSPDGNQLVSASTDGVFNYCSYLMPEMFNFDKTSGVLTSSYIIDSIVDPLYGSVPPPYGVSFSPDNTKLYMSSGFYGWTLYQYDLAAGTPTNIMNSRTSLSPQSFPYRTISALQLGRDGKIYVATDSTFVGTIENPNQSGVSCNYIRNSLSMIPNTWCWSGLPNFPDNFIYITLDADFSKALADAGDTSRFFGWSNIGSIWKWNFGDGSYSNLQNPTHVYSNSGTYDVTLTVFDGCDYDRHCETIQINSVGLPDQIGQSGVHIFPNPAHQQVELEFHYSKNENYTLTLFDHLGQAIQTIKNLKTNKVTINRGSLSSGIYVIQLKTDNSIVLVNKLIFE